MSGGQTQLTPDSSIAAGNPQPQTTVQTSAGPFINIPEAAGYGATRVAA